MHGTYKSYAVEQKQYGLRVLSESAMHKNLPKFFHSQKYIPFIECLSVKCLNFPLLVDTLRVAGIRVMRRAVLNVITSICPLLVDKDDLEQFEKCFQKKIQTTKMLKLKPFSLVQLTILNMKQNHLSFPENAFLLLVMMVRKNTNMIQISFF